MTNLTTMRKQAGMTQERLAALSGLCLFTIKQWERREREGRQHDFLVNLSMLADALECKPTDLLEGI